MKTLIVGAGIIGTIYGWALSQAGNDVTHLVRKGKKDQFRDGLRLDLLDERKGHTKYNLTKYTIKCVEEISPSDDYELIIVPTSMHQTEAALKQLVPVSGEAIFLLLSGNWDGTDFIEQLLPRDRYLMGYADAGGTIRDDGVYWTNLGADVHLGEVDGKPSAKLEKVKALFVSADMKPDVQENIVHWIWQQVAGTIGYAAGFAKHCEMDPYLDDKALLRKCTLATLELFKLCQLRGVDLKKFPEASFVNFPVWLVTMLVRWNIKRQESAQRYTAHAGSQNSLKETKVYFGKAINTADQLGFEMPNLKALGIYLQKTINEPIQ
ncbi:MAG TPA: 2-dehydropantoate 2-reductase N-terminal domain-containing protein [Anaerolineales bacterium]|nr:2-dehydropantoate 2-reductase N-terminal domain-containing protein [Anaerolineales bacterium]